MWNVKADKKRLKQKVKDINIKNATKKINNFDYT
jgi:hypothetical protein